MKNPKFFVFSIFACLSIMFIISACGGVSSDDSGGKDKSSSSGSGEGDSSNSQIPTDNCDKEPEASVEFCFDGKIYDLCGGKKYNPIEQFCTSGGAPHLRCDGKEFNTAEYFCFKNETWSLCGNQEYDPDEEFCGSDFIPHTLCGGKDYDVFKSFCYKNVIYSRCDSSNPQDEFSKDCEEETYTVCGIERINTAEHFCIDEKIYLKCGHKKYNPTEEFCFEPEGKLLEKGEFFKRCGGKIYDPEEQFCFSGTAYKRCGEKQELYNPTEQFCETTPSGRDSLYTMCGGLTYKPTEQFCKRTVIYPSCNGIEYDTDTNYCFNGDPTYKKCGSDSKQFCSPEYPSFPHVVYNTCGDTLITFGVQESKDKLNNAGAGFCYNNKEAIPLCHDKDKDGKWKAYVPTSEYCSKEGIYEWCIEMNEGFVPPRAEPVMPNDETHICSRKDRKPIERCNGQRYNDLTHRCEGSGPVPINPVIMCGGTPMNINSHWCDETKTPHEPYPLCGGKPEKPTECCNGEMAVSKGGSFDTSKNFCGTEYNYEDRKMYPLCSNQKYPPLDTGCFNGNKYATCINIDALGVCVSNTVLRCKQLLGNPSRSEDYIIDPLPGFTCNAKTGVITGKAGTTDVVQIGKQLWIAKDAIAPSDWANAIGLPEECNYTSDGCPPSRPAGTLLAGSCPSGFGIPKNEDWQQLVDYAGGKLIAGSRLKSTTGWLKDGNGTDSYGFNAKPHFEYNHGVPVNGAFWWVEDAGYSSADYWNIISADSDIRKHFMQKDEAASIRCVRYSALPIQ